MQTFDAGVTVDQWLSLVHVERAGRALPHPFTDCAHWWELAHHALRALETLHQLQVVHLKVAPDNICVPAVRHDAQADVAAPTVGLIKPLGAAFDYRFKRE